MHNVDATQRGKGRCTHVTGDLTGTHIPQRSIGPQRLAANVKNLKRRLVRKACAFETKVEPTTASKKVKRS